MVLVWRSSFAIEFRDRIIWMESGETIAVPPGVKHLTPVEEVAEIFIFEPTATQNTGNLDDKTYTDPQGAKI